MAILCFYGQAFEAAIKHHMVGNKGVRSDNSKIERENTGAAFI